MADFCKQCSIDTFGEDFHDMAGLGPAGCEAEWLCQVLCEGCGPTMVDQSGTCVDPHCLEKHGDDRGNEP